eukprot:4531608-Karenia_brevis.AAC.1
MRFARRMMAVQTEELKAERKAIPPAVYRLVALESVTPIQVKWNRLAIMQQVVHAHALMGSILHYLEELRVEKEEKAYQECVKTAAKKPMDAGGENQSREYNLGLWERSDRGPFNKTPDLCAHPLSRTMPRGGCSDSMWWTCLDGGSRWTRVPMT